MPVFYPCERCTAKTHLYLRSFLAEASAAYLPLAIFPVLLIQDRCYHTAVSSGQTGNTELTAFYYTYYQTPIPLCSTSRRTLEEGYCYNSWLHRQLTLEQVSLAQLKISKGNLQLASSHLLYTTLQNKPNGFDNQWFSCVQHPAKTHVDSQQKTSRAEGARCTRQAASITVKPQVGYKSHLAAIQLEL